MGFWKRWYTAGKRPPKSCGIVEGVSVAMAARKHTKSQLEDMTKGDLMKILIREYDYNAFEFQGDKDAVVKEVLKLQKKSGSKKADADEEEDNVSAVDVLKALLRKFGGRVTKKDDEDSLAEKIGAKWDALDDEDVPELDPEEWDALEALDIDVSEYRPDDEEDEEEDDDDEEEEEEEEEEEDEEEEDEEEEDDDEEDDDEEEDEDEDDGVDVDPEDLVKAVKKVKTTLATHAKAVKALDALLGNV